MSENKQNIPTYDEFKMAVAENLAPLIDARRKHINGPSALEYIDSDEGKEVAQERYDICVEKYLNGELTRTIFLGDSAFGVAYCLSMLY